MPAVKDDREPRDLSCHERDELRLLRSRVRLLEEQRENLKKAMAWFAKEAGRDPTGVFTFLEGDLRR